MTAERRYLDAWPSLLASLARAIGSVELAEDALQDAYVRWRAHPRRSDVDDPVAWIAVTARRRAIDLLRADAVLQRKAPLLVAEEGPVPASATGDDRIDLLLLACDPLVPRSGRIPLALRFVLGVPTEDIADVLLVEHTAMSARLTRAKRRIDAAGRRLGEAGDDRLEDALVALHASYTVVHTAPRGAVLGDAARRAELIDLARAITRWRPDAAGAVGLLALLLLSEARAGARVDEGRAVSLEHADRSRWNRALIDEGLGLAARALPSMHRFALEAGIAGVHASAPDFASTDWPAVIALYDRLLERWPSPSASIARAVAIGCGPAGADAGLTALETVPQAAGAHERQLLLARADLLVRAGRSHEARAAWTAARILERNAVLAGWIDARLADADQTGVDEERTA